MEPRALSDENTIIPIGRVDAEVKVAEINELEVADVKEVWEPGMECQAV